MAEEKHIHIVFDGPPSHESGRFVEVEDDSGASFRLGEWTQRDEFWCLSFHDFREDAAEIARLRAELAALKSSTPAPEPMIPARIVREMRELQQSRRALTYTERISKHGDDFHVRLVSSEAAVDAALSLPGDGEIQKGESDGE